MTRNAIVSLAVLFALGVGLFIVKSRVDATKKAQASGEEAQTVPAPEPTSQAPIPSIPVAVSGPAGIGGATGDINGDGYLNLTDYDWFEICFSYSGPGVTPLPSGCLEVFDLDTDGDVDLADFALFQQTAGHLPIPMRDHLGAVLAVGSTEPYSPRQTCGPVGCHDADHISNGEWFQQGRANVAGNVDMADDYFQDGRHWIKSPGRYGKWGQSFQYMLAAKDNTHPSQIDQTTFAWVKECSKCHAGGGPGEYDRDDKLAYNRVTGEFGYELLGKTPGDVALDGDYSIQDRSTGTVTPGAWDVTDLSGPDCLLCHRADRPTVGGVDQTHGYRGNTLAAGTVLENSLGDPVPAYAAAATAGQGWFSNMTVGSTASTGQLDGSLTPADLAFLQSLGSSVAAAPAITTLDIDYSVGIGNGSLIDDGGELFFSPSSLAYPPQDRACVGCHPLAVVAGMVWFDDRDIHYRKFNNLEDDDPDNDIPPERSMVCVQCHPGLLDHNAAKGNSFQLQYRDELDWVNFRSCRECHLTEFPDGSPNPDKHADAPDVPGMGDVEAHMIGFFEEDEGGPMRVLSCQACHMPYALAAGLMFRDITIPGSIGWTSQYLSADPLDPSNLDKSKWYPAFRWKEDIDGLQRVFPASVWINIYFGDWDQNDTLEDKSDDIIRPLFTWRVAQVVGGSPLAGTTDDDGDGRVEINRPEEILAYFDVLKNDDANGQQVAANPVLVRGHRVWYADDNEPSGVNSFEHEGIGIPIKPYPYIWGMDHNVLVKTESWGSGGLPDRYCNDCHPPGDPSPFFDRKVLIDPHGLDGQPIYETVRERIDLTPP